MTLRDLTGRGVGGGLAATEHGPLTITDALHLAADADIIPVILDDAGGITAYGRTRRTASPHQRHALTARDRACSFPGCDTPPAWTQTHHIVAWADGGPTNLDNLTLICGFHHREFGRQGWTCHIQDRVPWWTPPTWIDPTRTARQNHTHHLHRLLPPPPDNPAPPHNPTTDVPPTRKNTSGPRTHNLHTTTHQTRQPQLTDVQL